MPRSLTFRNAIAAITMAVAALCGGGKATAEQKGTLSIVEVKGGTALTPDARKKAGESLRDWLQARYPGWVVRAKSGESVAVWSPDGLGDTLSDLPSADDVRFHAVAEADQSDLRVGRVAEGHVILPDAERPDFLYALEATPLLDARDVADASAGFDYNSLPVVNFRFTPDAGRFFGRWTQKSIGKPFAIVVDAEVLSAPTIRDAILGGSGQISGNFTVAEATALAARLNSSLSGIAFRSYSRDTLCFTSHR